MSEDSGLLEDSHQSVPVTVHQSGQILNPETVIHQEAHPGSQLGNNSGRDTSLGSSTDLRPDTGLN